MFRSRKMASENASASLQQADDKRNRMALQKDLKNIQPVYVKYRDGSTYALTKWKTPKDQKVHLDDLCVERKLGQGGFGVVHVSLAFEDIILTLVCTVALLVYRQSYRDSPLFASIQAVSRTSMKVDEPIGRRAPDPSGKPSEQYYASFAMKLVLKTGKKGSSKEQKSKEAQELAIEEARLVMEQRHKNVVCCGLSSL